MELRVHFLSAPPERKWTESPAVRDPAFRIFKAGKEEDEIITHSPAYTLAEIPVRGVWCKLKSLLALHRNLTRKALCPSRSR